MRRTRRRKKRIKLALPPAGGKLCETFWTALALPLGELSPKVTERACRGEGSVYSPHSIQNVQGHSIHIAQRAGGGAHVPRRRSSEIASIHRCRGAGSAPPEPAGVDAGRRGRRPLQTATENPPVPCRAGPMSAHRRASRLSAADASDSRGTSSKSPRFIRRRRRFGDFPRLRFSSAYRRWCRTAGGCAGAGAGGPGPSAPGHAPSAAGPPSGPRPAAACRS